MTAYRLLLLVVVAAAVSVVAKGQGSEPAGHAGTAAGDTLTGIGFKVSGFRVLPNDVSAFITPVRDLNGDACALVKVAATDDFAFSSPLGIVKRLNEVGEIWLYLPGGTKLLTIKHPQWGVLRDYRFPETLESHVVYELAIDVPTRFIAQEKDTVVLTRTVTDTVVVGGRRPKVPVRMHALAAVSLHEGGPSWGAMFALMARHGFFVHAQAGFGGIGRTVGTCDGEGFMPGEGVKPYYTGKVRRSNFAVTAGAAHRILRRLGLFYGVGYGRSAVAWQLAVSEGGGYVLNEGLTHEGVAAEAGLLLTYGRISMSASVLALKGRQWQAVIGLGICL